MDFGRAHMEATGRGCYESLDPNLLPRLWLVYCDNPSDSGRVHSSVKARWLAGDADVIAGMSAVADCAQRGRCVPVRMLCMQLRCCWACPAHTCAHQVYAMNKACLHCHTGTRCWLEICVDWRS